jgi:NUMOD4 motif/HNH endonuclease
MEIWKEVPGYEGEYAISNRGRVKSLARRVRLVAHGVETTRAVSERILRPGPMKSGHVTVALGKGNSKPVHQLVLLAFRGPCPEGKESRHLNDVPDDNRLGNLKYGTRRQNMLDKIRNGHHALTYVQAQEIRALLRNAKYGDKRRVAKMYGVHENTIQDILAGRSYAE